MDALGDFVIICAIIGAILGSCLGIFGIIGGAVLGFYFASFCYALVHRE